MMGVRMKQLLLFAVVLASLAIAPIAAAAGGSSVLNAYGTNGSNAVIQVKAAKTTTTTTTTAGATSNAGAPSTLPFTGTDIMVFLVVGSGLVLLGGGLRRLGRDKA
jgi:hypothetical protein